jgi:hypothetical protein
VKHVASAFPWSASPAGAEPCPHRTSRLLLLPSPAGSVLPAVLRSKGVIVLSPELAAIIDAGQELQPGPHERALRATAVTAVDAMVAQSSKSVTARELSSYLCHLADAGQPLHGQVKRYLTKETVAY